MKYQYTQKSNWLLNDGLTVITQINNQNVARLNSPREFKFPTDIIKKLRDLYLADEEKGGLVLFKVNETGTFTAVDVIVVTNVHANKKTTYQPDGDELDAAFRKALGKKLIPLDFHTHPTAGIDGNIMFQSFNFLQQLNTSIQDQASTRWCFKYNGVPVRLPQILYVENSSMSFVGLYGGLVAPLCFTAEKDQTVQESMSRTFDAIAEWAEKPGNKGLAILGTVAFLFLAFRFPKVVLPTIACAGAVIPPLIYANRKEHKYFGITHGGELNITLPMVNDYDAAFIEMKAIEASAKIRQLKKVTPQIA